MKESARSYFSPITKFVHYAHKLHSTGQSYVSSTPNSSRWFVDGCGWLCIGRHLDIGEKGDFAYFSVSFGSVVLSSVADPFLKILIRIFIINFDHTNLVCHFLPDKNISWHLKLKIKKLFYKNCILDNIILYIEKSRFTRFFCGLRIRIRLTQKDRIRLEP